MSRRYTILFVCTGNTCRSPMAEGALRMLLDKERPDRSQVMSAGTSAAMGFPATLYAIEAARAWDVDISGHRSLPLTPTLIERSDLILGMEPAHVRRVIQMRPAAAPRTFLLKNFPDGSIEGEEVVDPIGYSLEVYQRTFLEIGEYLGKSLPEIVQRIDTRTNAS